MKLFEDGEAILNPNELNRESQSRIFQKRNIRGELRLKTGKTPRKNEISTEFIKSVKDVVYAE